MCRGSVQPFSPSWPPKGRGLLIQGRRQGQERAEQRARESAGEPRLPALRTRSRGAARKTNPSLDGNFVQELLGAIISRPDFKLQGNNAPPIHPNQNKKPNLAKGNASMVKRGRSITQLRRAQLPAPPSCTGSPHPAARTPTALTTYLGGTNWGAAQHHIHLLHARAGPGEPTAMLNTWVPCLVTGVLLIETQLTPNLLSAS